MNSYTGIVMNERILRQLAEEDRRRFDVPIDPANLSRQSQRELARNGMTAVSRNARCPCNSGKRFRKCHGRKS